jgi:hypothetical protein
MRVVAHYGRTDAVIIGMRLIIQYLNVTHKQSAGKAGVVDGRVVIV